MKLTHDGPRQYSPALGLDLVPGEHEYPDDKAEQLIACGLRPVTTTAEDKPTTTKRRRETEEV